MKNYFNILILGILVIEILNGVNASLYCCERTIDNLSCINVEDEGKCNDGLNIAPSYCELTSYCKTGTCVNQNTGVCLSTPRSVCEEEGGYWDSRGIEEVPQCQLGCCLSGGGTSFTTQIACNRLARDYNLNVVFDATINNQQTCLLSANPQAFGSCVYTTLNNNIKECKFITKKECKDNYLNNSLYLNVSFSENSLCSNPELGTICAMSKKTVCKNGNVYFVDTCDNPANIYDSSKINDIEYWSWVQEPNCSSSDNLANKNSASCGDCDYLLGSICKEKRTGEVVDYGNYICRDLDCKNYKGEYGKYTGVFSYPQHGESWCGSETSDFAPGDSSYIISCIQGETIIEQAETTRNKICKSELSSLEINGKNYTHAGVSLNYWRGCYSYNKTKCEDEENFGYGDCKWINYNYSRYNETIPILIINKTSEGLCVPRYPVAGTLSENSEAGFTYNGQESSSCALGNAVCYVKLEKSIFAADKPENWRCPSNAENNCSCIENNGKDWGDKMNEICINFGDCGNKKNIIGLFGYYTNPIKIENVTS